ncbi:MAG: ubiquinol-cytochrome c reductase iron-sulfur subunit [Terracidiphilus sp.]
MTDITEPSSQQQPPPPPPTVPEPNVAASAGISFSAGVKRDSRRAFLFKLSLLLNGAVGAVLVVPILGYLLGPAFRKDSSYKSWVSLGPVSSFPEGQTRLVDYRNPVVTDSDGETAKVACWVRRIQGNQFQVFAINCAHLGCPVRWFEQSKLFMCPCHGGAYYIDGSRASGPPERGLFQYDFRIDTNNLMIDAGQMPTLSNSACLKKPLIQIAPNASVQAEEKTSWPA